MKPALAGSVFQFKERPRDSRCTVRKAREVWRTFSHRLPGAQLILPPSGLKQPVPVRESDTAQAFIVHGIGERQETRNCTCRAADNI
jgi:hypothetical protein